MEIQEEVVGATVTHMLKVDEETFTGIAQALATHPFPKKQKEDDMVLFRSLDTPLGSDEHFFGLTIVNSGSRHHLKIPIPPGSHDALLGVYKGWRERHEKSRTKRMERTPR